MAIINLYTQNDDKWDCETIACESVIGWLAKNIQHSENFKVFTGDISQENEVSRKPDVIEKLNEASVFLIPASGFEYIAQYAAAVYAVEALTPKFPSLSNLNRNQESPNNSLGARNNEPRPNQRIVDVCGEIKSIPDTLQGEFARYVDNIEVRIGYYCVSRNEVEVKEIKDGDTLIEDIDEASVGVYGPYKSPNNSTPDIQIGDPINEEVVGVYQSSDAIGQVLQAPNQGRLILTADCKCHDDGRLTGDFGFNDSFGVGDYVDLNNLFYDIGAGVLVPLGLDTHIIIAVEEKEITFDITGDSSWDAIPGGAEFLVINGDDPVITKNEDAVIGPFKISSEKIDRLLVNVYAPSGLYKEDEDGRKVVTVGFNVYYQLLDDNLNPIGTLQTIFTEMTGSSSDEKGVTVEADFGALFYVEWSLERITNLDFEFEGTVVEEVKLKDVFGLFTIEDEEFGNVTTIQTKRSSVAQATAIRNPELNCIVTEKVYKYLGGGVFDTELTANTQAMQSLIRMALDPYIGRRSVSELDLDLLLSVQGEIETYFNNAEAGSFNYSFDSTQLSAQEILSTIAKAAFCTLWREGKILKAWFEKPQSIPSMVFTHRSKQPNSETWNTSFDQEKDSIEFIYTDDSTYAKETLYFPVDRSGTNPLRPEMTGIKGVNQATWQMMRIYNKMIYQNKNVDFSAASEGRFVKPGRMISVVKGTRILTSDGYIMAQDGLNLTLSQEVSFVTGDDHYLILKRRDGSTESVLVADTGNKRIIQLLQIPTEDIYTGNDALKTEFSFGNEAALSAQNMIAEEIDPSDKQYVKIKAINYSDLYYKDDPIQPLQGGFSDGFSDGFN